MFIGRKDKERGIFNYLRTLRVLLNKRNGLTLVEVLLTTFIVGIIFAALLFTLNMGNLSSVVSGGKLEVQQEVRRAMDWMVKDLRQTSRTQLAVIDSNGNNVTFVQLLSNETFSDPEFRTCFGYADGNVTWSSNQIGYSLDASNHKIIRTSSDTNQTWEFNHIANL